jgi:hypothetical protein
MGLLGAALRLGVLWLLSLLVAFVGLQAARQAVLATERRASEIVAATDHCPAAAAAPASASLDSSLISAGR